MGPRGGCSCAFRYVRWGARSRLRPERCEFSARSFSCGRQGRGRSAQRLAAWPQRPKGRVAAGPPTAT